jgi:tRNA dimethylallyltransferase
MQVYAKLAILTARPSAADEARVPHRLYGVVPPAENYSVGRWLDAASEVLAEARAAGRLPILAGGTGLYFKALFDGLSPVPAIPEPIREHWRSEARQLGGPALHAILTERDPTMAARLRQNDPQRLARALEVLEATGRSLAEWQAMPGQPLLDARRTVRVVLMPERETLYQHCNARFTAMIEGGALEEAETLMRLDLDPALPAMRAIGVRPLISHLRGEISLAQALEQGQGETRRYAKRQMTWIRGNMVAWNAIFAQFLERTNREVSELIAKALDQRNT